MIEPGDPAPDFDLADDRGGRVRLSDLRGRKVVIYFYPKDDTPGCTRQACALRDHHADVTDGDAIVLGISPDDVASHGAFRDKFSLPFPLLADPDHEAIDAYGVWGERERDGRRFESVIRSSFLVDEEGRIAQVWRNVDPDEHLEIVLAALSR